MSCDNTTIGIKDGEAYIKESALIANDNIGLLKVDGTTITSYNGTFCANIAAFPKASTSALGSIKFNQSQFSISNDGALEAISINELSYLVSNLQSRIQTANSQIDIIEEEISNL